MQVQMDRARFWGGLTMVVVAILIAIAEVVIHMVARFYNRTYDVSHVDLLVALVVGFVGFFVLSPRGAKEGGQFLVDNTLRFVQVIRSGRRKTDMLKAVLEDEKGHRATVAIPPLETEVSLTKETEVPVPQRRASDKEPGPTLPMDSPKEDK